MNGNWDLPADGGSPVVAPSLWPAMEMLDATTTAYARGRADQRAELRAEVIRLQKCATCKQVKRIYQAVLDLLKEPR